jgi:hypothetical protein
MRLTSGATALMVLHEEKEIAGRTVSSKMNQVILFDESVMAKPRLKKL